MLVPYQKLTLQQKQQIIEVFNSGMECQNIPQHIGVSGRSVARVLSEASINTKRRNRYHLDENYFDLIDSTKKTFSDLRTDEAFESLNSEVKAFIK